MEGRWNGELATVPVAEEGNQVCSYDLIFRDDEGANRLKFIYSVALCFLIFSLGGIYVTLFAGVWSQRQSRTTISGLTLTQHFWIKPVADGILKVETDDPSLRGSDITMQELGTNFVIITATSKRSGECWAGYLQCYLQCVVGFKDSLPDCVIS